MPPGRRIRRSSGGAEPSGSAASRPVTPLAAALGSTTVLLAASVLGMVLAFAEKWPCRAGTTYAGQFQRACYTDILPLYSAEGLSAGQRCPTRAPRRHPVEYPALTAGPCRPPPGGASRRPRSRP